MRVLAALVLAGATFAQPPAVQPSKPPEPALKPEDKCKVSGQIVSITTGEAVRRANLKLQPVGAGNEATATSDADGKFEFTGVTPGRYRLNAEKQGFLQQAYGAKTGSPGSATPLQLAKGQEMKGLTFKLTPHGIIAGRVLDDEGEPVNMAIVQPLRYVYDRGRRQLVPTIGNASIFTNDQGVFVIDPAAGAPKEMREIEDAGAREKALSLYRDHRKKLQSGRLGFPRGGPQGCRPARRQALRRPVQPRRPARRQAWTLDDRRRAVRAHRFYPRDPARRRPARRPRQAGAFPGS